MTDSMTAGPATEDDARLLRDLMERQGDGARIRLRAREEADDVSGHLMEDPAVVRLLVDDDDTEGHALDIRLPSAAEADAFRRKLLLTGALVGAVVLGAGGVALVVGQEGSPSDSGAGTRIENVSYHDTNPNDATV